MAILTTGVGDVSDGVLATGKESVGDADTVGAGVRLAGFELDGWVEVGRADDFVGEATIDVVAAGVTVDVTACSVRELVVVCVGGVIEAVVSVLVTEEVGADESAADEDAVEGATVVVAVVVEGLGLADAEAVIVGEEVLVAVGVGDSTCTTFADG